MYIVLSPLVECNRFPGMWRRSTARDPTHSTYRDRVGSKRGSEKDRGKLHHCWRNKICCVGTVAQNDFIILFPIHLCNIIVVLLIFFILRSIVYQLYMSNLFANSSACLIPSLAASLLSIKSSTAFLPFGPEAEILSRLALYLLSFDLSNTPFT